MKDVITADEMDLGRANDGYEDLLHRIRSEFEKSVKDGTEPLFTTDAGGDLYELFLRHLPEKARQHYNCNSCRHFVNRFGGLVRISDGGEQTPAMWSTTAPDFFAEAVDAVRKKVKAAKVTGVFITGDRRLGILVTGSWSHMAVDVPKVMIYKGKLKTPFQEAAEKSEDYKMLCNAVRKYRIETVEAALNLLRSNSLYRGEKVLGVAEWFYGVLKDAKGKRKSNNILWKKVAQAPTGFCHVSSSMIGTLLDDIEDGNDFDTVSRKFAEKMNPLQYQRPQAAPTVGNVDQAEKIVEKLGIANSLKRRYARLDEIETVWKPRPASGVTATGGVFAGVQVKQSNRKSTPDIMAPTVNITWEKFKRTVVPLARKIEFNVTGFSANYCAIVTAEDPDAPPIIQWDREEDRCPFNQYVYHNGSAPGNWGLSAGWTEVTAVTLKPCMWRPGYENHTKGVIFILKGCKDHRHGSAGLALFPEVLKGELREIRSTIEAYSKNGTISGYEESSACGIALTDGGVSWDHKFRVTTDLGTTVYRLDRWD